LRRIAKSDPHKVTLTIQAAAFVMIFLLLAAFTPVTAFANEEPPFLYILRIPLNVSDDVTAETADGSVVSIGKIKAIPQTTRWPSYSASAWGKPGEVCASAVNALHMLVSVEKGQGRTMSIIPSETIAPAAGAGASVVVTSQAGTGVFGAWAPPVGSKIEVSKKGTNITQPLSLNDLPKKGDTLIITVLKETDGYMAEIENRPGGRVIVWSKNEYRLIGRVIRPLAGTGRFEGTLFQKTGALRANHCGVIDFSSSPRGVIGGFQLIPWDHALLSKEMQGAWDMTQWMIIGPADGKSMMGGTGPLFKGVLIPGPSDGESLWDVWSTYGRKSLMLVRINGGAWQKLPEAAGRNDYALKDITHLRIYFPFTDEPAILK
jgi:hypothetical protein